MPGLLESSPRGGRWAPRVRNTFSGTFLSAGSPFRQQLYMQPDSTSP